MKKSVDNRGMTLLECIVALAVLGILASAFLGIQVSFAKFNQISSLNLKTGIYAGNLYEMAKGMSVPELSDLSSTGVIWNNDIKYVFNAERYHTNNHNLIDLVIHPETMDSYTLHAYGDSIQNVLNVSGKGSLSIALSPEEHHTGVDFTDKSGKIAEYQLNNDKEIQIVSIHANSMQNTHQQIQIEINEMPTTNWMIYVYEHPFQKGSVSIQLNGQTIYTKQLIKPLQEDRVSIYSRKTQTDIKIPISLQIAAFQDKRGAQPICLRQGIIWIKPY